MIVLLCLLGLMSAPLTTVGVTSMTRSPKLVVLDNQAQRDAAQAALDQLFTQDYRIPWEPRCVMCDRPRSVHGEPIEISGETVTPVCDLLHPGGLMPEGPAPRPGPRPLNQRLALARGLTKFMATAIVGSLGQPSKMPGPSYGLDAWQCEVGNILAEEPGSTCSGCYARKHFYRWYYAAKIARARRHIALSHPLWVEAMTALIWFHVKDGGEPYFRWHDSGDLQSLNHFENICAVAEATPRVAHWLPTREYGVVRQYLVEGGKIPKNLSVRLSSHWNGEAPRVPPELAHLPTSTVHFDRGAPVRVGPRRNSTVECRAGLRETTDVQGHSVSSFCGSCRACWTPSVVNVSYPIH